jgi:isopenicillin-N N-acyltransferase-like protein
VDQRHNVGRLPRIAVAGSPRDRGRQLGEAASEQIYATHAAYREIFEYYGSLDWSQARVLGLTYRDAIREFDPRYLEELQGVAEATELEEEDLLALNARTEILATASVDRSERRFPPECTSFGCFPRSKASEPTLIGQNWDWLELTRDCLIVLEAQQSDGPAFMTIVEAGLLAKCGMNAAGVGLATNALLAESDRDITGVPYHVLLRAILESTSVVKAIERIQGCVRASSANFLIGQADGVGMNIEAAAGDFKRLFFTEPQDALLVHTNHFLHSSFRGVDLSLLESPDSPVRLSRFRQLLGYDGVLRDVGTFRAALADHAEFPASICAHAEEDEPPPARWATLTSVIMDLNNRHVWVAPGNPCQSEFTRLDYGSTSGGGLVSLREPASHLPGDGRGAFEQTTH